MKKMYQNISEKTLKNYPFLWILGWFKFLPIIVVLLSIAVGVGFLIPVRVYEYGIPFLYEISTFIGFLVFIIFVLFVIRQVKFNSFRIHHKIPYQKSISIYFYFVFFILLLAITPFVPKEVYNYRVIKEVNSITTNFDEDLKVLNENTFFFYSNDDRGVVYKTNQADNLSKNNVLYILDESMFVKHVDGFTYNYSSDQYPIKISKSESLYRISKFIDVAKRFGIIVSETDPNEVWNKLKSHKTNYQQNYNLLVFESETNPKIIHSNYRNLLYNFKYNSDYDLHDIEVLYVFLFFSIILALLLWIIISVPITDFGFSVLAGALILVFAGVVSALLASLNADKLILIFLQIMIVLVFLLAYFGNNNKLLTRITTILSQLLIPVLVGFLFLDYFEFYLMKYNNDYYDYYRVKNNIENFIPSVLLITIILTVFFYKNIYRNSRILPN